jgi:hypothetical protein
MNLKQDCTKVITNLLQSISIRLLQATEPVPYDVLLMADPSETQIGTYLQIPNYMSLF